MQNSDAVVSCTSANNIAQVFHHTVFMAAQTLTVSSGCAYNFLCRQVCHVGDALAEDATVPGGFAGIVVDLFAEGQVLPALQQVMTAHL